MTLYRKINGTWLAISNPMVKVSGTWKDTTHTYVNDVGIWKLVDTAGAISVVPPELSIDNIGGNYINVAVKLPPPPPHDTDLRRIRVLAQIGGSGYPTNPNGAGFYSAPNTPGGDEPWSDWFYNAPFTSLNGPTVVPNRITNATQHKKFPPTYKLGNGLAPNTRYAFTAWSQDLSGNWSAPVALILTTGSSTNTSLPSANAAVVLPEWVGSYKNGAWVEGRAEASSSSYGLFDYGNQLYDLVKGKSNVAASVRLYRANDQFQTSAQTYGKMYGFGSSPYSLADNLYNIGGSANLNSLTKGQSAGKNLPATWAAQMVAGKFKGFSINLRSTNPAGTSQALLSQAEYANQGALYVRWTEA